MDELACCSCFAISVKTLCLACQRIIGYQTCVDDGARKICRKCRGSAGFIQIRGFNDFGKLLRKDDNIKNEEENI